MKVYFIDEIVRSALLTCSKPIHYYMEFLHYGLKGVKEVNYDSPVNIKTLRRDIDDNNEITLPDDYVDYVKVGFEKGHHVLPLVEKDTFNRLMNLDSDGNQVPYSSPDLEADLMYADAYYYASHGNEKGEHVGRHFGHKSTYKGAFKVITERNKIVFDPAVKVKTIILEYISTGIGEETNSRTSVPGYVAEAIERYILWRYYENQPKVPMNQKMMAREEWIQAHKRYRSRKYQLSKEDVLRSLRQHTYAAIKS